MLDNAFIESKSSFLALLENRCYGEGIDIRAVKDYLRDIRALIIQNMKTWGPIEKNRISLYPHISTAALYMKPETFSPELGSYIPIPGALALSLG